MPGRVRRFPQNPGQRGILSNISDNSSLTRIIATDTAERFVEAMYSANIPVIQRIEGIDSSRAPKFAQVRYFNNDDRAASERVLLELKKEFPDATATRIPLPAPKGQLEVVLPQAK